MTFDPRAAAINLPHARTVLERLGRSLEAQGAFGESSNGHAAPLVDAFDDVRAALRPWDDDPPSAEAVAAADTVAAAARALVDAILATPARGDRLGQHVRNLFECLGLGEEGARLSLLCGENPDSLLR